MLCQLLVSVLLLAPSTSLPEEKIDGKLILGKWVPEKQPEQFKITIEYLKDNKLAVELEAGGDKQKGEGTYKLDGNKLELKVEVLGQEHNEKRTIKKLTESEMVTFDEDKKEERTFKKVK
jgi:uncharacterized protein (TIGR03066 family)